MQIIRFLYNNILDSITPTGSAVNPNFPVVNMAHPWRTRAMRSVNAVGTQYWDWDRGPAATPPVDYNVIVFDYHNFSAGSTIRIYTDVAADFSSTGAGNTTTVPVWNAERLVVFLAAAVTHRYIRISVSDGANTDGFFSIGRAGAGTYFAPSKNFDNAYVRQCIDAGPRSYSDGGQMSALRRVIYEKWAYQFSFLTRADMLTFRDIYRTYVGQYKPYWIFENPDDLTTTYYVENEKEWVFAHLFMDAYYSFSFEVRESL